MSVRFRNILLPLGGAVIFSGIASALYYYLNKNDEEKDEILLNGIWVTSEISVPIDSIGLIIGRQGANIRLIQERTNTKINFSDEEVDGYRLCLIRGAEENVVRAKQLVNNIILDKPVIETRHFMVPLVAIGRIIGRNGEHIRGISHSSGAKINVDKDENGIESKSYSEDMKRIVLKGTKEQIEAAKALVMEKVQEEEEMRQEIQASAASMSRRARSRQANETIDCQTTSMTDTPFVLMSTSQQELFSSPSGDKFIEAYISSVETAHHFWLQVVGPRSVQLDKLVTAMTEYYDNEENSELHQLNEVSIGEMVAARFPHDNSWYRGKVYSFDHSDNHVTVYYVDFGDTETISLKEVRELRTDYLKLNFQAVEALLAYIKPESAVGDETTDVFEELCYAAQWKVVMVKVTGYQQIADKTIPTVQIIDTTGPTDVDVAVELVRRGLAQWMDDEAPCARAVSPKSTIINMHV